MISYYLVVSHCRHRLRRSPTTTGRSPPTSATGNISQLLLKPIDYLRYRLLPVHFRPVHLHRRRPGPRGLFIFFLRDYFVCRPTWPPSGCFSSPWASPAAAVPDLLHHGHARLLGARGLHLHLHPLRLRIPRQAATCSPSTSCLPPCCFSCSTFTPFPLPAVLSREHLPWQNHRPGLLAGPVIQALWVLVPRTAARLVWHRGVQTLRRLRRLIPWRTPPKSRLPRLHPVSGQRPLPGPGAPARAVATRASTPFCGAIRWCGR
jgi:hypothetical protein